MEKELAEKLRDAGSRLERFPSDVDQLLSLLHEIVSLLEKVDQSPSELIQNGYSKLMKALLAEQLLRHTDGDVQVSVASCISEITRITAPEAPYEDDRMKEVFQLIVSSFANLSNKSSRSYDKCASILQTVAKIRSCVVMLDLECDGLISEMFQHFICSIRDDHPKNIFESMETIMTVVLEESEDVPVELLMPILASLRTENEEIPAIARKLGESVLTKSADKLKPFLEQAVEFSGLSLDGYSKVVATICNGSNGEVELDDVNVPKEQVAGEKKLTSTSSDGMTQVPREVPAKSVNNNGVTDTVDGEILNVSDLLKKPDEANLSTKPLDTNTKKVDKDDLDTGNLAKVDAKQERTTKKRGRKPYSTKATEPSYIDGDKEAEASVEETDGSPVLVKDTHDQLDEDLHASPNKEEPPRSLPELLDGEVNVSSLSPNKSVPDESPSEKVGVLKKKDALAQELASVDSAPKNITDGTSGTEIEPERHLENKNLNSAQEDAPSVDSAPAEAADVNTDSEIKPQNQSEKKENFAEEHEPSKKLPSVIAAAADGNSDSEINAQELSRKNNGDSGQDDELSEDLLSPKLSDRSCDSEKLSGKEKVNLSQEDVEPVSLKVDDEISDLKEKPQRRPGKKAIRTKKGTSCIKKGNMLEGGGASKLDTEENNVEEEELTQSAKEGDRSELATKPLVQSSREIASGRKGRPLKKSDKVDVLETNLSNKKHEMTNKEGNRRDLQTDGNESGSETEALLQSGKEKTSIPAEKTRKKSGKGYVSDTKLSGKKEVKTNMNKDSPEKDHSKRTVHSKRKREISGDMGDVEYGANLVGAKVKIWWPDDKQYYEGIIESFDIKKKKHKVSYTDGDEEVLALQKEMWKFVDDATVQEEMNEDSSPDSSAKSRSWKKAKRNSEKSSNKKQMGASRRRGEAAATNKAKRTVTRSGEKDDSRSETTGGSEENWESDDESMDDVLGPASKSKENESKGKSKPGTPKTVTKSKDKTPRSGNASKGTGKAKSSLSKLEESSNLKGKSSGSGKASETNKVKSANTSKVGKSGGKSGNKRKRG
ncbi:hypothetical protein POM88_020522 [Heracleum sosnowskyi]|uniref:Tudor domain-containing protein n=1 Tax=Heracleum sosnowskyi TaxID=360622 RepID=A0AAD8MRZ1_9APIA|nr:hypothetical protein POM88_020522 [Heracleum sosnowskyi]